MEKGEEDEVSTAQVQQQNGVGSTVDLTSKVFITEDEGIGDSETNTPRPGSSAADYHAPASPEQASATPPLDADTQPLPGTRSSDSEPQPSSDTPKPEPESPVHSEHPSSTYTPQPQSHSEPQEYNQQPELEQPEPAPPHDSPAPSPPPGDRQSGQTEQSEEFCAPQSEAAESSEGRDTNIETHSSNDQHNGEDTVDRTSIGGKSDTYSETDVHVPQECKSQDSGHLESGEVLQHSEMEVSSPQPEEEPSPPLLENHVSCETPASKPEELPCQVSENNAPHQSGSSNEQEQSSSETSEKPLPHDINELVVEESKLSHAPEKHQMSSSTGEQPPPPPPSILENHVSPKDSPTPEEASSQPVQNHASQNSSPTFNEPASSPQITDDHISRQSSSSSSGEPLPSPQQPQENRASRKSSSASNASLSSQSVASPVSKTKASVDSHPSQSLENVVSQQLRQVMSALQDYHAKLSTRESVPDLEDDEKLKKTLMTVTAICQTCCSTSAALGQQLQQARQMTDNISKDLTHKLHSVDLKACLPLGYCMEDGESIPEERQAAERKRLARAAEARAAVARASHAMHIKAQELASAEAELMEAELAAAAAVEVAEEAILQLRASKASEEAKQAQEREEKEKNVPEEEGGGGETELERDTEDNDVQNVHENGPENVEEKEEPDKNEVQEEQTAEQCENVREDEADKADLDAAQIPDAEKGEQGGIPLQHADTDEQSRLEAQVNGAEEEEEGEEEEEEEEERTETHIDVVDTPPQEQPEPEPELTTQKVFKEVHVVHESQESFADDDDQSTESWSRFIYSVEAGEWDTGLGCVVRADSRRLGHDDLEVTRVLSAYAALPLRDGEELVSNIITLGPPGQHQAQAANRRFSPFLLVSLPHCAPRMHSGREPVVRMRPLDGGSWRDLETHDVTFEDIREHKFVEASVREASTLCVVLRMKRETAQVTQHAGRFLSSADSRVTVTWPQHTVKGSADVTVAVQPVDQNVVSELRMSTDIDCTFLMASSPILHCDSQGPALLQPLVFTLPCPPNPAVRPSRPSTSLPRKADRGPEKGEEGGVGQRPATARPFFSTPKKTEEVAEEEVHVLWRQAGGTWSKLTDVQFLNSKKKDLVIFEMHDVVHRIVLLRTRSGVSQSVVERTACILEHMLAHHPVHFVLRQHAHLPHQVILTYCHGSHLERALRTLAEEGYSQGPAPSNEVKLREGQVVELSFRGNLKATDEEAEFVPVCAFHNNIPFRAQFCVAEIDPFAQKGFPSYRGFVQLTTTYTAPFGRRESVSGSLVIGGEGGSAGPLACFVSGTHLVAELLASLPKPDPQTPRPLTTAPVSLKSYGPITNELLRHVAQQLAADDWRRLVPMLNIRRTRLQAILRQNMTTPPWLPVYDVLLTWSKRLPQSFDRVEMLCAALMAVGRHDLVEEIRDKDQNFRHNQALTTREVLLNKAFVRIARHEKAVSQWRRLALFLGLHEEQVKAISDSTCSARERCIRSLQQWKSRQDDSGDAMATVTLLSHKLRLCRYRALAREIESIR